MSSGCDGRTNLGDAVFVFVDLETTGLRARGGDRMVEIYARRVCGEKLGREYETLVNPGRTIPVESSRVHGICDEDVADAPSEADAVGKLGELLDDSVFVAHNASFDRGFIDQARGRSNLPPLSTPQLDTLQWVRRLWPEARGGHSLGAVAKRLAIVNPAPHRARGDVGVLLDAWPRLLAAARARWPIHTLGDLLAFVGGEAERAALVEASAHGRAVELLYLDRRRRCRRVVAHPVEIEPGPEGSVRFRWRAGRIQFRLPLGRILRVDGREEPGLERSSP